MAEVQIHLKVKIISSFPLVFRSATSDTYYIVIIFSYFYFYFSQGMTLWIDQQPYELHLPSFFFGFISYRYIYLHNYPVHIYNSILMTYIYIYLLVDNHPCVATVDCTATQQTSTVDSVTSPTYERRCARRTARTWALG